MVYEEISEKILKSFFQVYNRLGYGFLEKVYGNAMMIELKIRVCKRPSRK